MSENVGSIEVVASLNTKGYSSGADQIEKDNKRIGKSSDDVQGNNKSLGASFANLGKVAAAGIAVIAVGLGALVVNSLKSFSESQAVMAQTEAVIKSTGGAAGQTAKQVSDLATSLQGVTRFSDETIQTGENMLLTFTNIGKKVFPQATQTLLDMAQAMGGDVKGTAIQLGKALNDPTQGLTALTRVGVTFTEEQKKQIKTLQESGDVVGAQNVVLKELQKEFGGSAKAAGKTLAGQLDILKNRFDNVMESIGRAVANSGALSLLSDGLNKVAGFLEKIDFTALVEGIKKSQTIQAIVAGFKQFFAILGLVIQESIKFFVSLQQNQAVMNGLKVVAIALAIAIGAVIAIIVLAVIGLAALAAGIAWVIGKIVEFGTAAAIWFAQAGAAVAKFFYGLGVWAANTWASIQRFFGGIGAWFTNVFNTAKQGAINAFNAMVGFVAGIPGRIFSIFSGVAGWFRNTFNNVKNAIVNAFTGMVNFVGGVPAKIVKFFVGVGESIGQSIKNALNNFLHLPLKIPEINVAGKKFGGQTLIPRLAKGGIITSATLAMVGEGKEPEAVIPLSKLESMISGNFNGTGNGTTVGTIIIHRDVDIDLVAQKLGIKQLNQGRGVA